MQRNESDVDIVQKSLPVLFSVLCFPNVVIMAETICLFTLTVCSTAQGEIQIRHRSAFLDILYITTDDRLLLSLVQMVNLLRCWQNNWHRRSLRDWETLSGWKGLTSECFSNYLTSCNVHHAFDEVTDCACCCDNQNAQDRTFTQRKCWCKTSYQNWDIWELYKNNYPLAIEFQTQSGNFAIMTWIFLGGKDKSLPPTPTTEDIYALLDQIQRYSMVLTNQPSNPLFLDNTLLWEKSHIYGLDEACLWNIWLGLIPSKVPKTRIFKVRSSCVNWW